MTMPGDWWIGFDCGHYGDTKDYEKAWEVWKDNEDILRRLEEDRNYAPDLGGAVRSLEYVQSECRSLIDQIIEYEKRISN